MTAVQGQSACALIKACMKSPGANKMHAVQDLDIQSSLASLFRSKHADDVTEAFEENNTEARLWVATVSVFVEESQLQLQLAAAAQEPVEDVAALSTTPEAPEYHLPAVNSSQNAVANEIIQRILLAKREFFAAPHEHTLGTAHFNCKT